MDAGHLSGRRVDGLYLCPRSKNPTCGADGIRMESVHPCPLLEATLRASRPKWEVQCTLSPPRVARHGCVETLEAVEAMPLPGPAQWQRRHCQQRDLLSVPQPGGNVVAAWLRDCRSHISEQTGDLYRGRYPCTYRPSSGGGAVARPDTYPTWEVAFHLCQDHGFHLPKSATLSWQRQLPWGDG